MGYNFSHAITIDPTHVGGSGFKNVPFFDIANYVLYFSGTYDGTVNVTNPNGINFKTVANGGEIIDPNGLDLVFTSDLAGLNILNFERVFYDGTTGKMEFHVQIPNLSHTSVNTIYIQCNCAAPADKSNITATWESAYVLVVHGGNGSIVNVNDSTSNANNGTNNGTTFSSSLMAGPGGSVSLANGDVDFGAGSSLNIKDGSAGLVIQYVVKPAGVPVDTHYNIVVGKFVAGSEGYISWINSYPDGAAPNAVFIELDPSTYNMNAGGAIAVGSVRLYTQEWHPGDKTLTVFCSDFVAGTLSSQQASPVNAPVLGDSAAIHLVLGYNAAAIEFPDYREAWSGQIDELRIRNAPFPNGSGGSGGLENRVKAEFSNFNFIADFYTLGPKVANANPAPCNSNPPVPVTAWGVWGR